MCKEIRDTSTEVDKIINEVIIVRNKPLSYDEIFKKLISKNVNPFRYSVADTVQDRLDKLRTIGYLKYSYQDGKYHKGKYSPNIRYNIGKVAPRKYEICYG